MITIKNTCLNCRKTGHLSKECSEAITSYGIICFNIDKKLNVTNKKIEGYFFNKFIELSEYNYFNLNNINLISTFYDNIKIILIRRKHSLNYIEFLRGKYNITNKMNIKRIIQLMSIEENLKIKNNDFDTLWNNLWINSVNNKKFFKEYKQSKVKFDILKANNFYGLLDENNLSTYLEPEWEFPKGRKNIYEKNIDCAIREFYEETNIISNKIHILERLNYLEEVYKGTNNINYKNVYYLAANENLIDLTVDANSYEISDLKWYTIPEAINKIRPYYNIKIKLIHQVYFFIVNLINDIMKKSNLKHPSILLN